MPGKYLLLETESEDIEAAEPQGKGEVVKCTYWKSPDHYSLKQFSGAGVNMKNRAMGWQGLCLIAPHRCEQDRKEVNTCFKLL